MNPRVIAREQDLGYPHAPEVGGPRVLRTPRELAAERVVLERLRVPHHAGHEPAHGVDQRHGGDLAAALHVVADRDLARGEAGKEPVVDPLVAAADDDQARLARELSRDTLVESIAPVLKL